MCAGRALPVLVLVMSSCQARTTPADGDAGAALAIGEAFVEQRGCARCHQSDNAADGVLSGRTAPVPGTMTYGGNLTPDPLTGIGNWADIEVVRAIRYGVDNQQLLLCASMPHYDGSDAGSAQPFMTDLEAAAIVAYLRSLPRVARRDIPLSICPPIKEPPSDLAGPPGDMATPPADDLNVSVPADLRAPPPMDLASPGPDAGGAAADAGVNNG